MQRRVRANDTRFTFASLLKLAEMQMLEPRELLLTPRQAFSARRLANGLGAAYCPV
jgi:hypothetical protein